MASSILLVDDDESVCRSLAKVLTAHGYTVRWTADASSARRLIVEHKPDLIVTDLKMPRVDGVDLLKQLQHARVEIPVVVISGFASVENIVAAMKYGAVNFFEKPVKVSKLIDEVRRVLAVASSGTVSMATGVVTQNAAMMQKLAMIEKAGPTDAPVIITGESGTGKELFARLLHNTSVHAGRPLVTVNCAAIPETLMESELFGYEKGAFTDARERKAGKFEAAEGGSLFLDEIGELSPGTQAKILRAVQEREYAPLGSTKARRMNVRFIAATNRNLDEMVSAGTFREDLYYRLAVIRVDIPPLRERKDDIMLLTSSFIERFNLVYGKQIDGVAGDVKSVFLSHNWPGNVRELKNCVERGVIFAETRTIDLTSLPEQYNRLIEREPKILNSLQESISREIIIDTLNQTNWSRRRTAEILGVSRRTLYNKMKKLNI